VQRESLDRAKRLKDWSANRFRNNLVDESEVLQADANLQNREMELQDTLTEVDTALRSFNSLRETQEGITLEASTASETDSLLSVKIPKKSELREDVKAKLAANKAAIASAELGTQRNRPNLELYGTYSINGRNQYYSAAVDQSMTATRPFSIVGIRFTTPLDFDAVSDIKKAYTQEVMASEMSYKRRVYEVDQEWDILVERFENLKKRLALSQKLETVQEKKLIAEKRRYNGGRSTIFQVLQFEQDFANAQLLKLRNKNELIATYNQLKLFSGETYE
jgi:outer membrane protein TolC